MTTLPNNSTAAVDSAPARQPSTRPRRRAGNRTGKPTPGWKAHAPTPDHGLVNPRPPAVPATLALTLEQYFAACALVGLLGSQKDEPDKAWVADWACAMGSTMARVCRKKLRAA
jgi:hypothetical protein